MVFPHRAIYFNPALEFVKPVTSFFIHDLIKAPVGGLYRKVDIVVSHSD